MQTEIPSSRAFRMEAFMTRSACSTVICMLLAPSGQLDDSATIVSRAAPVETSIVHETRMRRWVHTPLHGYLIKMSRDANILAQLCGQHHCALQPHFCCVISG